MNKFTYTSTVFFLFISSGAYVTTFTKEHSNYPTHNQTNDLIANFKQKP